MNHGFYRYFSWECIMFSVYLVTAGAILLKNTGKPGKGRVEPTHFQFEKTTSLVEKGIFKYIRHPLYSSLLFLTWGIFLKNANIQLLIVSLFSTAFLYFTAIYDEKECIVFFGGKYRDYMKRSKRFIPYVI